MGVGGGGGRDALEERARSEKAAALEEIFRARVSVLIGPAGTGKTTLLQILCGLPEVSTGGLLLLAPTDREAAALTDTVLLVVELELGVPEPVPLLLLVCEDVAVPEPELEPVEEALAPGLREEVGELLKEALRLSVLHAVAVAESDAVGHCEAL